MKLAAAHQTAGDVGRLQKGPLGWRVGGEITGDSDENVPALIAVSPFSKLPNACLKHLVGMKTCILAKECTRQGRDQPLGRVSQDEMAGNEPGRGIDLMLAIEGIEQMGADFLGRDRKVIEAVATVAGQRCRRHVQITGEIEGHGPVEQATHGFDGGTVTKSANPLPIRLRDW